MRTSAVLTSLARTIGQTGRLFLLLVFLCALTSRSSSAEITKDVERRHALIIGNSDYEHIPALRNPVNDGESICGALRGLKFEVDCRKNVRDRRSLRDAVRAMTTRLKRNDVALFYFAGHGVELEGENYLIPTAADVQSKTYLEDEAIRLGFIFDELKQANVRLAIVILDACRDNPYARTRSTSSGGLGVPTTIPAGSIVIFPTAPGKVAYDGSGNNGLFTTHLLRHVAAPGLTIEEMFKRVISGVREESGRLGKEQIPWMNLSFTGEFCFGDCSTRVSGEQFQAMVLEKQQVQQMTAELQERLSGYQRELLESRSQMRALEARFATQPPARLSSEQQQTLMAEREEHAAKTARLQQQEAEVERLNAELEAHKRQQADFARREAQFADASGRIDALERQLALVERGFRVDSPEANRLRTERDTLLRQRQENDKLKLELTNARSRLERMQAALAAVDRQQRELDAYKARIGVLEAQSRDKEAALVSMRADLEVREKELQMTRHRLAALQDELRQKSQDGKIAPNVLDSLRQQQAGLVDSSRIIAERDRELSAVRDQLKRLEGIQTIASLGDVDVLRQRLAQYDRQQGEINSYKVRLEAAEKRLKDATEAAVRGASFVPPVQ